MCTVHIQHMYSVLHMAPCKVVSFLLGSYWALDPVHHGGILVVSEGRARMPPSFGGENAAGALSMGEFLT